MNVSAKDKASGKQTSIIIKASSGLSEEEIDRMVKDAEAHKEEDKKFKELVDVRNQADSLIHGAQKSIKELGDEATDDEKKTVETAVAELQAAVKSDDKAAIEAKIQVLSEISGKLSERVHAKQGAADQAGAADAEAGDAKQSKAGKADESVVDAEFEEVEEKK